jgi:hypothetical protein
MALWSLIIVRSGIVICMLVMVSLAAAFRLQYEFFLGP